jgi:hypothetical protein
VAVLVSLIYFSLQMRQNSKHSRALVQQGRAARSVDIMLRRAELDDSDGMEACYAGSPDVTARDLRRFRYCARAALLNHEDSFLQHREGLLDGPGYENSEALLRSFLTATGHRVAWELIRESFGPDFRDHVDRMIANSTLREAGEPLSRWKTAAVEIRNAARK